MDAQEQHDYEMSLRRPVAPESKQRLQAALAAKERARIRTELFGFDPIASAMETHPGLTREEAEEEARAMGFF